MYLTNNQTFFFRTKVRVEKNLLHMFGSFLHIESSRLLAAPSVTEHPVYPTRGEKARIQSAGRIYAPHVFHLQTESLLSFPPHV